MGAKGPESFPDAGNGHADLYGCLLQSEAIHVVEHCNGASALRLAAEEPLQEVIGERRPFRALTAGDCLQDLIVRGLRPSFGPPDPVEADIRRDRVEQAGRGVVDQVLLPAQHFDEYVLHGIQRPLFVPEHESAASEDHGPVLAVVGFNVNCHVLFPVPVLVLISLIPTPGECGCVTGIVRIMGAFSNGVSGLRPSCRGVYTGPNWRIVLSPRSDECTSRSRIDGLNRESWDVAQSDPRAALALSQEAINRSARAGYAGGRATGLLNAGWAFIYTADYEQAMQRLHEALAIFEECDDTSGRLKALNALGVVAHRLGDSTQALERYRKTLELARSAGNRERLLAALNNLGELSMGLHHYSEARAYYDEAHTVAEELGEPGTRAIVKVNLGRICHLMGDDASAQPYLEAGISLARSCRDSIAEAEALTTLGTISAERGEFELAERQQQESLALAESTGHPPGVVDALNNLGTLYLRTGRLEEAGSVLERASVLGEEIGSPMSSLPSYERLAELYENSGRLEKALQVQRRLITLQRTVSSEDAARKLTALRTGYELERSRSEAEIFRLRNVELREKSRLLEEANYRMQVISDIAREITASLDLDEVTDLLYERVNSLMEASVFGIALYNEQDRTLDYALYIEEAQRITPFVRSVDNQDSFAAWAVRNEQEIVIFDADKEYRKYVTERRPLTRRNCRSLVFVPLFVEKRVVGVLTIQSHKKKAYSQGQLEMLRALAAFVGVALDNSRKHATIQELNNAVMREKAGLEAAYERIAHLANHDNLTELPNRRLLKELLAEHIPLSRRQGRKFGVLYLDLDDFKPVNDTFGHASGDSVLVRIAERLRATVRSSDTVARIGGDEFVLIVRDIDGRADLEIIARKVLEAVTTPVPVGQQMCTLGVSIGVSIYPEDGESGEELLRAADGAMYRVKDGGKLGIRFADGKHYGGEKSADSSISSSSNTN